jgi:hypothetical protein
LDKYPHNQQVFHAFRNTPLLLLKVRNSKNLLFYKIKCIFQGTPGFRAHASRIFNVFASVIDALDKDPDLSGIKQILAESELIIYLFNYLFEIKITIKSVGRTHARRRTRKQAYMELRVVILEVLSDMCKLDDDGN